MKTKRIITLVVALLAVSFFGISSAQAGHHHHHASVGVYVGLPGIELAFGRPYYPAPVYYEPAPVVVYQAPAPVIVHRPAPVVVYRQPPVV